ncbi:MAG: glutamine-hydrolyzing carbamoyl-phosphate synthase small subunit [Acidobacteria bacterium]|nr:glutamine-hydrolyzing carbamoyl-phosphate synthase small subunit [Acidobacteriota bacterium]
MSGRLILEDGSVFHGEALVEGSRFAEIVFNTSMTGYQEILTDPSYRGQIVIMTQPHIGNYGAYDGAEESHRVWVEGFVAREFTGRRSGLGDVDLGAYLETNGVPTLAGIDTRAAVRRLRDFGAMRGMITSCDRPDEELIDQVRQQPTMEGRALVDEVTCESPYDIEPESEEKVRLAVYDFGVKQNILRSLVRHGARVTVLPARTPAADCLALGVDGVVLSNGPGDPEPLHEIVREVRELVDARVPTFGICLGHQLLGLALGGKTFKLKFGHHGGNQPVRDEETGQVSITSQNHGFALSADSLPDDCKVAAVNLNDGTVEAFKAVGRPIFSVQYHPEAAPGPHDAARLFGEFLDVCVQEAGPRNEAL